ncbi:MAG: CidA/LrgA family protein [Sporomusaceae bacterium]|nr:CidA/LrgA family protein [Sporomusaceae bacterium]
MMMRFYTLVLQIAALSSLSWLGHALAQLVRLDMMGNIFGMALLLLLLERKWLPLRWIETGANFLIAEMLLFFIPSAIGVIQFKEMLQQQSLALLAVIIFSTALVITFVGLATELVSRSRKGGKEAC